MGLNLCHVSPQELAREEWARDTAKTIADAGCGIGAGGLSTASWAIFFGVYLGLLASRLRGSTACFDRALAIGGQGLFSAD